MDSALRPREIQARIRAGQSLEEVARVAGVPEERIEAFAAPVIAEREHIAGLALAATVRRRGETSAHRNLRPAVAQRLTAAGVDPDLVEWDAWREEDRRWTVRAHYAVDGQSRDGLFRFDQAGRFSVATNDDARWLIADPDRERDDSDEFALVRALKSPAEAFPDVEQIDRDEPRRDEEFEDLADGSDAEPTVPVDHGRETASDDDPHADDFPTSAATPQEIAGEVEAEINNYGVVPQGRSELDVLYDMLGGIAEDSINIYAGLSDPVLDEAVPQPDDTAQPDTDQEPDRPDDEAADDSANEEADQDSELVEVIEVSRVTEVVTVEQVTEVDEPDPEDDPEAEPTHVRLPRPAAAAATGEAPARPRTRRTPKAAPPAEPEQPSLVEIAEDDSLDKPKPTEKSVSAEPAPPAEPEQSAQPEQPEQAAEPEKPAAKPRKSRKKRASIPSWDEIMFGGPPTQN